MLPPGERLFIPSLICILRIIKSYLLIIRYVPMVSHLDLFLFAGVKCGLSEKFLV